MRFINVRYRTLHRWSWDAVMADLDGSLTGGIGNMIVSTTNITKNDQRCKFDGSYYRGMICSNTKSWIRFSFNNAKPSSAKFIDIENMNKFVDISSFQSSQLTYPNGFMVALEANQDYAIDFEGASYPINISYTGTFYGLKPNEYLIIKHKMNKKPDQVVIFNTIAVQSLHPLNISENGNGDWYWDNDTRTMSYIIHNKAGIQPFIDMAVYVNARKCLFPNCEIPAQPYLMLPATARPATALYWSNSATWQIALIYRNGQLVTAASSLPKDYDTIFIPSGVWVVVDITLPILTRIRIDGVLELSDTLNNKLTVNEILINGGQLIVGWINKPFTHKFEIQLIGTRHSEEYILPNGMQSMGSKGIGVYGGLDLHGIQRSLYWTQLAVSAYAKTNKITLKLSVDWQINEEIVISTTSYAPFETETFTIIGISNHKSEMKII